MLNIIISDDFKIILIVFGIPSLPAITLFIWGIKLIFKRKQLKTIKRTIQDEEEEFTR